MTVAQPEYDCRTAAVRSIESSYFFDLPLPGRTATEIVFDAASDFIDGPVLGCSQTFRLEMVNG